MDTKDAKIAILEKKIESLESEIKEYEENSVLSKFSEAERGMIKIIGQQIDRLARNSAVTMFDKDETKLFDILVKDYVALRGKIAKKIEEDKDLDDDEVAELIQLVQGGE